MRNDPDEGEGTAGVIGLVLVVGAMLVMLIA